MHENTIWVCLKIGYPNSNRLSLFYPLKLLCIGVPYFQTYVPIFDPMCKQRSGGFPVNLPMKTVEPCQATKDGCAIVPNFASVKAATISHHWLKMIKKHVPMARDGGLTVTSGRGFPTFWGKRTSSSTSLNNTCTKTTIKVRCINITN